MPTNSETVLRQAGCTQILKSVLIRVIRVIYVLILMAASLTAAFAQDAAKIDKLTKELIEIANRAIARGNYTPQEQERIQEIEREVKAEYNTPQVQQIMEQQRQREQQEEQKRESEYLNKYLAMGANVPEKLSVKYKSAEYVYKDQSLIITWDNNMKRVRTDKWFGGGNNDRYIYVVNVVNKTLIQHHYGGWQDDEFYSAEYYNRTSYVRERVGSEEQLSSRWRGTFVKQSLPDRTYAGKPCRVFRLTEVQSAQTLNVTYAIWNNVVLFYEYTSTNHGETAPYTNTTYEAVSVTENVPEAAFSRTLNITWLP